MPIVASMEVTAALMFWLEMENVIISIISQPAVTMTEEIVVHQTLPTGQDVPTILLWLEMVHVMIISKPKLDAITMPEIVVQIVNQLGMENAIQKI